MTLNSRNPLLASIREIRPWSQSGSVSKHKAVTCDNDAVSKGKDE